jgi:hypothetical protein
MELSRTRLDLLRAKEEAECLALAASRFGGSPFGIRALQALTETLAAPG